MTVTHQWIVGQNSSVATVILLRVINISANLQLINSANGAKRSIGNCLYPVTVQVSILFKIIELGRCQITPVCSYI